MRIMEKLFGEDQEDDEQPVDPERNPVHEMFTEDAFDVQEDLGVHPEDTSPNYGNAMEEMADNAFNVLDTAQMTVTNEMRDLLLEGYRIIELDNGEESVKAAYLDWEDNIDEAFSNLVSQATYRNEDGNLTVDDFAVKRGVDMMYDEVESINEELRQEGADIIGGRRQSSVKASARASRYDNRSCMNDHNIIGWGKPGINSHISFSIKGVDRDTLSLGGKDIKSVVREEVESRLDFYEGRTYDKEGTVERAAKELREIFDDEEEVEVTVEQKYRTDRMDRTFMDDHQVYNSEKFTYETVGDFKNTKGRDKGLREFDRIARIVEDEGIEEYREA